MSEPLDRYEVDVLDDLTRDLRQRRCKVMQDYCGY